MSVIVTLLGKLGLLDSERTCALRGKITTSLLPVSPSSLARIVGTGRLAPFKKAGE